ncbi:MAG: hypothetical protein ACLFPL_01750 [Candidatus Nanoarchaeia archaeon]
MGYFKKIHNKSQVGFEFLVLTVFLLVVVGLLLGVSGYFISSFNTADLNQEREEFAQVIIDEFDRAESSSHRLNRTIQIKPVDLKKFPLSFVENQSFFILQDIRLDGENSDQKYYYSIPDIFLYNQTFFSRTNPEGVLEVNFETNTSEDLKKVDLSDFPFDWNVTSSSTSSVDCSSIPGDWVEVPGNSYFGTSDFCVMQFEAKDVSGVATSQPSSTPWVNINFTDARSACTDLNSEHSSLDGTFKMITNREWMTIARDAEQQDENWDSGTVGSGSMYRGHSDDNPNNALSVSNTGDYYDGTGNSAPSTERRVLELSNGEIIWDLGGNAHEWTDMLEDGSSFNENVCSGGDGWYSYFGNDGDSECSFVAPYSKDNATDTRYEMGPLGDYNANEGVGRIFSYDSTGRALLRGGRWINGADAGVFTASFGGNASSGSTFRGFRCSYAP